MGVPLFNVDDLSSSVEQLQPNKGVFKTFGLLFVHPMLASFLAAEAADSADAVTCAPLYDGLQCTQPKFSTQESQVKNGYDLHL